MNIKETFSRRYPVCSYERCAAYERYAFAWDVLGASYLHYKIFWHSINLICNIYGAVDNKNVGRNRIGRNLGEDNGSMICRTTVCPIIIATLKEILIVTEKQHWWCLNDLVLYLLVENTLMFNI